MTKEMIFSKIVSVLTQEKGEEMSLSLETPIMDTLAEDSVELMELVITLEEEFQLEIPDDAINDFQTLGDVVEYLSAQLSAKGD